MHMSKECVQADTVPSNFSLFNGAFAWKGLGRIGRDWVALNPGQDWTGSCESFPILPGIGGGAEPCPISPNPAQASDGALALQPQASGAENIDDA